MKDIQQIKSLMIGKTIEDFIHCDDSDDHFARLVFSDGSDVILNFLTYSCPDGSWPDYLKLVRDKDLSDDIKFELKVITKDKYDYILKKQKSDSETRKLNSEINKLKELKLKYPNI